jgi:succinoglycan biosynthesis transport protein ExoP
MHFTQFLTILRARAGLIVTVVFCALVAGALVTIAMPKRYEAVASVMVDLKGADSVWATKNPGSGFGGDKLDSVVSTQLDILGSPAVGLKVVESLKLESNPNAVELLNGSGPLVTLLEWKSALLDWLSSLLPGAEDEDRQMALKDWMADRLLRNMNPKANRDSRLIRVTYSSSDPEFSAAAANAFVRAYQDTMLQLRVQPAKQTTKWFDEQVRELKRNLELAEAKLAKFQQAKGIVATDERMDLENSRLADLSAQLSLSQSQSYESQAKERQIRDFMAGRSKDPPPEVVTSNLVQQLRANVSDREARLGDLAKRVGPNHPQYQSAANELKQLKQQLKEAMRSAAQSALAGTGVAGEREGSLRTALERQRGRVLGLKQERNEVSALVRDVENAQRAYNTGVERMTQTRMESQVDQASEPIIYSATVPTKPASPSKALNMAIALVAGLAFGIGFALFSETVNRYVRSEQDIVEIIGVPVLAVLVPRLGGKQNVRALKGPSLYSLPRM